ncbi:SAM-dependent methyltransferase [Streptomyces sp. V2]|uniref:class I SAM-dependent methyltransferase n=1 Tax=Streptomyces sp. V2 TaxID=1424099 RepID=UPI000D670401|nr:methyltransferase domain-containing protein [Streptomyces sp. V2]PWG09620.1 SAM-dependent methyltransferase [Streptomyces sp. V2]
MPELLTTAAALEATSVVANNTMNRERGLTGVNSYARELGFDPVSELYGEAPAWLDLCSGEGLAMRAAAPRLPGAARLTAVDLVGPLVRRPLPPQMEEVTASVSTWTPTLRYDLITCVHGLHYVGDQLGLLVRAASWLTPGGLFAAHFDPASVRHPDGSPAARPVLRALRAAGFAYSAHRLTLRGGRGVELPFRYVGADPGAGANYTGQAAVGSYYEG